jgi:phosphoglucosamine mutase
MMAVTEDGEFLSGDVLLAILAEAAVTPGDTVAVPVDTSLAVEDFLDEKGVTVERTPVGDVHIAHAVAAGARFGGEPSGAWIWQDETYCPDGPLAALKLAVLATERPLADRAAAIPTYPIRRSTVETTAKTELMGALERAVTEEYETVSGADGVRVSTADGWFLVRASGTESLVRVTAEAREAERSDRLAATALDLVENTRTAVE